MTKLIVQVQGVPVEYADLQELRKALRQVPVAHYLELEEQAKINLDLFDSGMLPLVRLLACWSFLLRRHAGEDVTFTQAAAEITPDAWQDGADDTPQAPPDPPETDSREGPSPT